MKRRLNFVFIGCGPIARQHADVVRYLGHHIEAAVARTKSARLDDFAKEYRVSHKVMGIKDFLNVYRRGGLKADCIVVCTPWDVNAKVLQSVLPLGLPVMVEKPAVLSSRALRALGQKGGLKNVFVAYNRRFYDFVPYLKSLVQKQRPICVDVLSAEPLQILKKNCGVRVARFMPQFYTSHVIDLLFFLFGHIRIRGGQRIPKDGGYSWVGALDVPRSDCPIQLKILMDCPQNSYIKFYFRDKVAQMLPYECLSVFQGIERMEDRGKVVYQPKLIHSVQTGSEFKPGFLKQMKYFILNFVHKRNGSSFHMEELKKVTRLCEELSAQR